MGRIHGPPPEPSHLRVLKGKAPLAGEPIPETPIELEAPIWLNDIAACEYKRVVPILRELKILYAADAAALEAYCDAYATMVQAALEIENEGLTYETEQGQVKPNPQVAIKNQAASTVRAFCQEFGLTPSARTRINLEIGKPTKKESKMKNLLGTG
jgi:P27 family predicted phage terminase small subunit